MKATDLICAVTDPEDDLPVLIYDREMCCFLPAERVEVVRAIKTQNCQGVVVYIREGEKPMTIYGYKQIGEPESVLVIT